MGRDPKVWFQTALVTVATLLFAAIVLFTLATNWAEAASDRHLELSWWLRGDVGTTILVVRVLQGLLTGTATAAVSSSFVRLHWQGMQKEHGLNLVDLLALSPTTALSGTIQILLSRHAGFRTRAGALARVCLTTMPWLAGILLFARTSLVTVFDTALVYDVTSGIGPFNSSYVGPFIKSLTDGSSKVIPYSYSSVVYNLITNTLFSTVTEPLMCMPSEGDLDCESYILSGGLSFAAPWTPPGHQDHPLVRIADVPAVQVEFQGRSGPRSFKDSECVLFGSEGAFIAAELCLAPADGSMHAGLFICNGTEANSCKARSGSTTPNMTTTMTLFTRQVTVLAARSNLTTMSLSSLSPPNPITLSAADISAYRSAISWLLDYSPASIPPPSSIIELFWSNQASLSDRFTDGILINAFRSVLTFPIWLFNANNYGNTQGLSARILNPNLPREFYTQAAVVSPLVKLRFDPVLLVVFMCLEGVVLAVLWIALATLFLPSVLLRSNDQAERPAAEATVSSFPVADFLFKTEIVGMQDERQRSALREAGPMQVLRRAGGVRVGVGNAGL